MGRQAVEEIGQLVDPSWTVEDYEQLPDDGLRYEILDGELAMTPAPSTEHQRISRRLQFILYQAIELSGRGEVFDAPFDVELGATTIVQPDLVVVLAEQRQQLTARRLVGAPYLVVEILSVSTAAHDRGTKLKLYARFGIKHYWLVDPEQAHLREYVLDDDRYRLTSVAREGEAFVSAAFPELSIPVADLFRPPTDHQQP